MRLNLFIRLNKVVRIPMTKNIYFLQKKNQMATGHCETLHTFIRIVSNVYIRSCSFKYIAKYCTKKTVTYWLNQCQYARHAKRIGSIYTFSIRGKLLKKY